MQLKCIKNTIKMQWNKLDLPCPATESIIPVAENKREISDYDSWAYRCHPCIGASPKARQKMASQ